jgi:hypothetical protein
MAANQSINLSLSLSLSLSHVKEEYDNRRAGFLEELMMKYKAKYSGQWTGWK